jgi:hypothetical protein
MTSDGSARFVPTAASRAAVKGREPEVLDALGVDWRRGRPHINCPYPEHTDNDPSWRWDAKRDRAFCSCIEAGKSDSIFDVVMKVRRLDFEAAKLHIAELLGRTDLIKTKGSGTGTGQKTDLASLLDPPANNRDDGLPFSYLAARLGIPVDDVPKPATKVVGIKSLGYFDPPAQGEKGGKPKLVGHYPCAVFETVAADGHRHAHRIYLTPDGRAKAELGTTADGKARDPKKSARRDPNSPSTAGCCAVWGNPNAVHVILAEGIETACAIAVSCRAEIEKGDVAVLSAITAGGIEAFTPWPATRRITVAADRDEAKPGAGFQRGEKAARNLALRLAREAEGGGQTVWRNADHDLPVTVLGEPEPGPDGRFYQQVQYGNEPPSYVPAEELHTVGRQIGILIALPGKAGMKYDFADLFCDTDPDRVRNIIGVASPFQPSLEEIEDFNNRGRRKNEIEEITQRYLLPALIGLRVEYRHTEDNRVWLHKYEGFTEDKKTGERTDIWKAISTPFGALVLLSKPGTQAVYGLRVHLQSAAGTTSTVDFMCSELSQLGASGVRSALMGAGLRVANGGEMTIVEILKQVQPGESIQIITALGWNRTGDVDLFFIPGGQKP